MENWALTLLSPIRRGSGLAPKNESQGAAFPKWNAETAVCSSGMNGALWAYDLPHNKNSAMSQIWQDSALCRQCSWQLFMSLGIWGPQKGWDWMHLHLPWVFFSDKVLSPLQTKLDTYSEYECVLFLEMTKKSLVSLCLFPSLFFCT